MGAGFFAGALGAGAGLTAGYYTFFVDRIAAKDFNTAEITVTTAVRGVGTLIRRDSVKQALSDLAETGTGAALTNNAKLSLAIGNYSAALEAYADSAGSFSRGRPYRYGACNTPHISHHRLCCSP